jgi:hypothetical protein
LNLATAWGGTLLTASLLIGSAEQWSGHASFGFFALLLVPGVLLQDQARKSCMRVAYDRRPNVVVGRVVPYSWRLVAGTLPIFSIATSALFLPSFTDNWVVVFVACILAVWVLWVSGTCLLAFRANVVLIPSICGRTQGTERVDSFVVQPHQASSTAARIAMPDGAAAAAGFGYFNPMLRDRAAASPPLSGTQRGRALSLALKRSNNDFNDAKNSTV